MKKFKVGDRVKSIYGFGTIVEIEKYSTPILVYHENWSNGHYGNNTTKRLHLCNRFWWFDKKELELVEESNKPTEIKIDGNEIIAKPFKITTDDLLAPNIVNFEEQYKRYVLGIWDKENPMIKKEGNEMIESMNLIDLYASKHKESIEKNASEEVEELRKNCDVINKYNELVEQFKKDCDELYLSQFTEEERNEIIVNHEINDSNMQLRKINGYLYNYQINKDFKSNKYYDVMNERNKKLLELDNLVKIVKSHVGIAKTKEEVEEILTRYEIINKKGKLVV